MPLETQIKRNGRVRKLRWGGFHVTAMIVAASWDSGQGVFEDNTPQPSSKADPIGISPKNVWELMDYGRIAQTPMGHGGYEIKNGPYFFQDVTDGEILEIRTGDVLIAGRYSK